MPSFAIRSLVLFALAIASVTPSAVTAEPVFERIAISPADGDQAFALRGLLARGTGEGPRPAIIALHGCGGLFDRKGEPDPRTRDWMERWQTAGYTVLFPDSFGSRGLASQCKVPLEEREARPRIRARDVVRAANWLAAQPGVDAGRMALIGWSHGGSTVLSAVRIGRLAPKADFKTAIAFYPGCRAYAEDDGWTPRVPLAILMGAADDWTPPEPCRALAAKHTTVRYVEYPEAVHGFDAPNSPVRVRTGLARTSNPDGTAKSGTNPAARAAAIADVTRTLAEAFK